MGFGATDVEVDAAAAGAVGAAAADGIPGGGTGPGANVGTDGFLGAAGVGLTAGNAAGAAEPG